MPERVILSIGTKKGLFVVEAAKSRRSFALRGPFGPGVAVYATLLDTRGTPRLYASSCNPFFGMKVLLSTDLGKKFNVYRRNGVSEYVVWRGLDRALDWFILRAGQFDRLEPTGDGLLRSEVFPGLWLDSKALLAGDLQRVHQVLHQGLASPEHAAFVAKLQ